IGEGRKLKQLHRLADYIISLEDEYTSLTDEQLRAKTDEFKTRFTGGEDLDDLLPEGFAVAREASFRVLGQKHHPVQVMGGAGLPFGNVAEMKTGEGKTLICVLPAYINSTSGGRVQVIPANYYLA